jgi:asparagine synthase (glutamine-hydrolysing)
MLEGVDRVVDLIGPRTSALEGIDEAGMIEAVRRGDVETLRAAEGQLAVMAREDRTVRLARTIGLPLRYFVAKMYHGPFLVVSDRMDRIFEWCQSQRIAWQFDPAYTRMVPAHYLVELDQVGCPDPAPRYRRFFDPTIASGPADIEASGDAYIRAALAAAGRWVASLPPGQPVAVAFSGGIDSTATLLITRQAFASLGRNPDDVRPFTLDFGGGPDRAQAERVVETLGIAATWEPIAVAPERFDLEAAIAAIEDYHPMDVECAAASLCLLEGIRERYPDIRYLIDGDGGDENLKSYPLEDSDLTLSSILRNPLLYQEGWGVDAIKHSLAYSGGLSRSYVRTSAPAAAHRFDACSPFTLRSVIAAAAAIPFDVLLDNRPERLATLKSDVVRAGVRSVLGIDMPVNPKRRFQDGAAAVSRPRPTKAWCRTVFNRLWQARLREADAIGQRSGNEMTIPVRG